MFDVWDGALSSWKMIFFFLKCGHFFLISSTNRSSNGALYAPIVVLPFFLEVLDEDYFICIPKNTSYICPSRLLHFRTIWCTFTRLNPLLWPFTWFGSIMVKTISWILLIISDVVNSFGWSGLGIVSVHVRPQQNSVNHFCTILYDWAESE